MEYEVVCEIANRALSIAKGFFKAYDLFFSKPSASSMTMYETTDIQNHIFHVIHAAELLSKDEAVVESRRAPMELGAGMVISSDILASSAAEAAKLLREIVIKTGAIEDGFRYSKLSYSKDIKKLTKHHTSLSSYYAVVERDFNAYLRNTKILTHDLEPQINRNSVCIENTVGIGRMGRNDNKSENSLVLIVYDSTIMHADLRYSEAFFYKLDTEMPLRYRNKVSISVHWDPLDERELYDIPEVRDYFVKLFLKIDSIFFWLDPYCDFFQLWGYFLYQPKTRYRFANSDTYYIEPNNFVSYINMGFDKLNRFCDRKGISEEPSSYVIYQRIKEMFPEPS